MGMVAPGKEPLWPILLSLPRDCPDPSHLFTGVSSSFQSSVSRVVFRGSTKSSLTGSFRNGFLILKHRFSQWVSVFSQQLRNVGTATVHFLVGILPPWIPAAASPRGGQCWRTTTISPARCSSSREPVVNCFCSLDRLTLPEGGASVLTGWLWGSPCQSLCVTCGSFSQHHGRFLRCCLPMGG